MVTKRELNILLQTGPITPPDPLVRDLETVQDISIDVRRLGASFRGGGVATFIAIASNNNNTALLADILYKHSKRLKTKGNDDLVVLVGGSINSDEENIGFSDVYCQKYISLKEKAEDKIREILEEHST